jgi:hypothetical protein
MKKQSQQQIIDLDTFDDVSLFQMIPAGTGMGLASLKMIVDSIHNGNAKLSSLLLVGNAGLQTHSSAFLRALGIENYNHIYAAMFHNTHDMYVFFCTEQNDGYIINNIENAASSTQYHLCNILKKQQFSPYNYMEQKHDYYNVPGLVVMTARDLKKAPEPILDAVDHIVELENYTPENLELVILQRLKYASVEIEDEYILQEIVKYGDNDLVKSIRFMRCCIAVMQSGGRNRLQKEDVIKAGRLNRLPDIDEIPF